MIEIEADTRDEELEDVKLAGVEYRFAYPKVSPLLSATTKAARVTDENERGALSLEAQDKWLALGFGPEQWAHIQSRLDNEGDVLDFPHMQRLFTALFEVACGSRPPTWRGDSSQVSPEAFQREAGRNRFASTPTVSPLGVSATS